MKLSMVKIQFESILKDESIMRKKQKREKAQPAGFLVQHFIDQPLRIQRGQQLGVQKTWPYSFLEGYTCIRNNKVQKVLPIIEA